MTEPGRIARPDGKGSGGKGGGEAGEVSRLMLFFAVVYTVEGIGQAKSGIVWQPLSHYLKEARGWGPVEVSASLAVLDLPWIVKPLYGLLSDFLPLAGYRRRNWLRLAALLTGLAFAFVAWSAVPAGIAPGGASSGTIAPGGASLNVVMPGGASSVVIMPGASSGILIPALAVTAIALAMASTVCGALLVENGRRLGLSGAFVNQQWLWFNVAALAAALAGGWLTQNLSAEAALRAAAWIAAAAPLAILAMVRYAPEDRARIDRDGFLRGARALASAFRSRTLWLIGAFLFCYYFSPGFGTPLYFQLTDRLHFSQSFIGVLSAVSAAGWIMGGLVYRPLARRLSLRAMLTLSLVFGAVATLSYFGLSGPVSAVVIYFLGGMAAMIANVVTLSLAAAHCPARAEGFIFAALMSVINLATPLADVAGSALYEHVFDRHLGPLIVVSAGFTAFVLVLVPWVGTPPPATGSLD